MRLQPNRPPGRVNRKAAAYASDIAELRSAGYTYEAIREALQAVGVTASTSALRREMHRFRSPTHPVLPAATGPPSPISAFASQPPADPPSGALPVLPVGREGAETFFRDNPANSLLKSQETP